MLNEKHHARVNIQSPYRPDARYAETLYRLYRDLDAARNGSADEIRRAFIPYHQIACLSIMR